MMIVCGLGFYKKFFHLLKILSGLYYCFGFREEGAEPPPRLGLPIQVENVASLETAATQKQITGKGLKVEIVAQVVGHLVKVAALLCDHFPKFRIYPALARHIIGHILEILEHKFGDLHTLSSSPAALMVCNFVTKLVIYFEFANKTTKYFQKIVIFFCTSFPLAYLSLKQRAQAHNGAFTQVRENGFIC